MLARQGVRKRSLGQQAFLCAFLIKIAMSGEEEGEESGPGRGWEAAMNGLLLLVKNWNFILKTLGEHGKV